MYIINIKNRFIKLKKYFFCIFFILLLASCSILDNENAKAIKLSKNNLNKVKCPQAKIPYETTKFVSNKKYLLKIKKIEMVCKNSSDKISGKLNLLIESRVKLEFKYNKKINKKDLNLPHIYIAIVDVKKENILAKMYSDINIENKDNDMLAIINKFKFKYENYKDLVIYFGIQ